MKYLIDTNIIIYHLNGTDKATRFLSENLGNMAISFITRIEVLSHPMSEGEELVVREFLDSLPTIYPDETLLDKCVEIRRKKHLKIPDCIIAATALINSLVLVTRDTRDFYTVVDDVINPLD